MSYSWRERLRLRRQQLNLTSEHYDWIEKYIEQYCAEADRHCRELNPNKAVDLIIDEMSNAEFDQFTKGIIDKVTKQLKKKKKSVAELRQEMIEEEQIQATQTSPARER